MRVKLLNNNKTMNNKKEQQLTHLNNKSMPMFAGTNKFIRSLFSWTGEIEEIYK